MIGTRPFHLKGCNLKNEIKTLHFFKGFCLAVVFMVVSFCTGTLSLAETTGQATPVQEPKPAVAAEKYKTTSIEGSVTMVEADGTVVLLDANRKTVILYIKKETVMTRNGQPAKFSDIKVGDRVIAKYAGMNVAVEAQITGVSGK
jgi:hypothetical protein